MSNDGQALIPPGMLLRVIQSKQEIVVYYDQLLKITAGQQNFEILRDIYEDELKHLRDFNNLFVNLFGEKPNLSPCELREIPSFTEGIKKLIIIELSSYSFYSNIYFEDANEAVRTTFLRGVIDENRHAASLNFILTKLLENK